MGDSMDAIMAFCGLPVMVRADPMLELDDRARRYGSGSSIFGCLRQASRMGAVKNRQIVSFITMAERTAQTKQHLVIIQALLLASSCISIMRRIPESSIITTISMRPKRRAMVS